MEWKVGDLARATGLTVRTLHHYDEIGLLRPSARTGAGHRLYSDGDVRRLYRIVALRGLGLSLDSIGPLIDGDGGLEETLRMQIERLDEQIEEARRLRGRLEELIASGADSDRLIATIGEMKMYERYYTDEQLDGLAERRAALGDDGMREAERAWQEIADGLREAHAAGTDPADPSVQALIDRADGLIAQFTGGDAGTRASLDRMYADQGTAKASRGMFDEEVADYMARARAVRGGG